MGTRHRTSTAGLFLAGSIVLPSLFTSVTAHEIPQGVQKLVPGDGTEDDFFGWDVSVSGNRAVVGAQNDNFFIPPNIYYGSAYVFQRDPITGGWTEQSKIVSPDFTIGSGFGSSVSLSADAALIGAPAMNLGNDEGAAYVFRFNGSQWPLEATLTAPDGRPGDWFGYDVALNGDVVVVSALLDDDLGPDSGSAYVYRKVGAVWNFEQKLLASDGEANEFFGRSVAIWGNAMVVGSSTDDDLGTWSGSAYVFEFDGTQWVQTAQLYSGDAAENQIFGSAVSISDDGILVGAPFLFGDPGFPVGAAYVFRRMGSQWNQEAKLVGQTAQSGESFGGKLVLSDRFAFVGSEDDDDNGFSSGSGYLFEQQGSQWVEVAKLLPPDGRSPDEFGYAVSTTRQHLIGGAPFRTEAEPASGAAYTSDIPNAPAAVGAVLTGMSPLSSILCRNLGSDQHVTRNSPIGTSWDCEGFGLAVTASDPIAQQAIGTADLSLGNVGGSTTGIGTVLRVICTNLTTGGQIQISQPVGNTWDCQAAGLSVRDGDQVRQRIAGSVQ